VILVTSIDAKDHRYLRSDFGQSAPKGGNVLCNSLPPRIYESLKTLCALANSTRPLQAHEIASATGLPPAQTAKILQSMTWAGFVESRRGTKGGFWLVVPAGRIRVTDVVAFFARHSQDSSEHFGDPVLRALTGATARCQKEFRHVTVADIAKLDKSKQTHRTGGKTATTPKKKSRGQPRGKDTRVIASR
jgi:Rrf2 family protein